MSEQQAQDLFDNLIPHGRRVGSLPDLAATALNAWRPGWPGKDQPMRDLAAALHRAAEMADALVSAEPTDTQGETP